MEGAGNTEPSEDVHLPEETTTTEKPDEVHSEDGYFFRVKPDTMNYLEDVLSNEEPGPHRFNPNEFLKKNAEKVNGVVEPKQEKKKEEVKEVVTQQPEVVTTEAPAQPEEPDNIEETILPEPSTCELEYDVDLRNECTSADWTELFFWNEQFKVSLVDPHFAIGRFRSVKRSGTIPRVANQTLKRRTCSRIGTLATTNVSRN